MRDGVDGFRFRFVQGRLQLGEHLHDRAGVERIFSQEGVRRRSGWPFATTSSCSAIWGRFEELRDFTRMRRPTSKNLHAGPPYVLEWGCGSRADAAHRLVSSLIRPQSRMIFEQIAGPLLKLNSSSGSKHQGVSDLSTGPQHHSPFHPSRCAQTNENSSGRLSPAAPGSSPERASPAGGRRDCRANSWSRSACKMKSCFSSRAASTGLFRTWPPPVRSVPAKGRSHSPTNGPARSHIIITIRPLTVPAWSSRIFC